MNESLDTMSKRKQKFPNDGEVTLLFQNMIKQIIHQLRTLLDIITKILMVSKKHDNSDNGCVKAKINIHE